MPNSYKPEVRTYGESSFAGNALRFATCEEAEAYVHDLMMRWTRVDQTRVVDSDDPVSYRWDEMKHRAIPLEAGVVYAEPKL